MRIKRRKGLDRCEFCGQRVHFTDVVLRKSVDKDLGWLTLEAMAHKACVPKPEETAQ